MSRKTRKLIWSAPLVAVLAVAGQWSERAIARTTPALFGLFSVVTLAADVLIEQRGAMAPRTTAWYDKTSPSFADAIGPGQTTPLSAAGNFYAVRARARIDKSPAPLVTQDARLSRLCRLIVQSIDMPAPEPCRGD